MTGYTGQKLLIDYTLNVSKPQSWTKKLAPNALSLGHWVGSFDLEISRSCTDLDFPTNFGSMLRGLLLFSKKSEFDVLTNEILLRVSPPMRTCETTGIFVST